MKPKIMVLVQEKFKNDLLPPTILDHLHSFAECEIVVDPYKLSDEEFAGRFQGVDGLLTTWEIRKINTPDTPESREAENNFSRRGHGTLFPS